MDKSMSNFGFGLMALIFKVRDWFRPRIDVLKEAEIKPGFCVLDYGCGPGSYILPLAKLAGTSGQIYALDLQPMAIRKVRKIASQKSLKNVKTIQCDGNTGLANGSVDAVLLYDTYHILSRPDEVLREIHRVLRSGGTLSFSDHHMKDKDILRRIKHTGLFRLSTKGKKTYRFIRID